MKNRPKTDVCVVCRVKARGRKAWRYGQMVHICDTCMAKGQKRTFNADVPKP